MSDELRGWLEGVKTRYNEVLANKYEGDEDFANAAFTPATKDLPALIAKVEELARASKNLLDNVIEVGAVGDFVYEVPRVADLEALESALRAPGGGGS